MFWHKDIKMVVRHTLRRRAPNGFCYLSTSSASIHSDSHIYQQISNDCIQSYLRHMDSESVSERRAQVWFMNRSMSLQYKPQQGNAHCPGEWEPRAAASQLPWVTQCSGIQLTSLAGPSLQGDRLFTIALVKDRWATYIVNYYRHFVKQCVHMCVCVSGAKLFISLRAGKSGLT